MRAPEPLSVVHALDSFESTRPQLDAWLKTRALANETFGASRTYVLCKSDSSVVVGFYCLSQGAIGHSQVSSKFRRNMPDPIPVTLLGRLAVGKTWTGKGLGGAMLQDAVLRSRQVATIVASRGMLVHALDEEAAGFYQKFGFTRSAALPLMLVLSFG